MFIRKRLTQTKKWGITEHYQVLETFREGGKVKQRVICNLEECPTPEKALDIARRRLEAGKRPYRKYRPLWEKKRLENIPKLEAKVKKLEYVVSKMSPMGDKSDTTGKA